MGTMNLVKDRADLDSRNVRCKDCQEIGAVIITKPNSPSAMLPYCPKEGYYVKLDIAFPCGSFNPLATPVPDAARGEREIPIERARRFPHQHPGRIEDEMDSREEADEEMRDFKVIATVNPAPVKQSVEDELANIFGKK